MPNRIVSNSGIGQRQPSQVGQAGEPGGSLTTDLSAVQGKCLEFTQPGQAGSLSVSYRQTVEGQRFQFRKSLQQNQAGPPDSCPAQVQAPQLRQSGQKVPIRGPLWGSR